MTRRVLVVGAGPVADAIAEALRASGVVQVQPVGTTAAVVSASSAGAAAPGAAAVALDLVIEATPDLPLSAKTAALAILLAALPGTLPIAVATRAHTVDRLLPAARHGSRVVGLHLLSGTAVAELAMPAAFDDAVVDGVLDLLEEGGISALPCQDVPGRIVDRLVTAVALEVRTLIRDGRATPDAIEAALAAGGLSLTAVADPDLDAIAAALHAGLGEPPRFTIVAPVHPAAKASPRGHPPVEAAALAGRLEVAAIAEAYRLVGDAIAGADEIERAMTRGAGWAAGPFTLAGRRGLRSVVAGLAAVGREPGVDAATADRFAIPALLWQMATV